MAFQRNILGEGIFKIETSKIFIKQEFVNENSRYVIRKTHNYFNETLPCVFLTNNYCRVQK